MAFAATRTLLALFVTICASGRGFTAEKSPRKHSVKQPSAEKGQRASWEPPIHLDGRPVERYSFSSSKPMRSHRYAKAGKESPSPLLEDVDPEWVNLDGFAIVGGAPINITGPAIPPVSVSRPQIPVQPGTRVNRTAPLSGVTVLRINRRPPQSSSGPRQPERVLAGTPLLDRRRHHNTKPQSDQRNRSPPKLASESVHVVSLQAQRPPGRSAPVNRAAMTKIIPPEPEEYEAKDISVRVMSPQSVLISWVDPAVEMEKITPGGSRFYTVKYREKGESARWEYKDSTQRRVLIDSLSADGMYEFSVRISQGENHSKWSTSVFQRTPESAPSGPPENFQVTPVRGKGTAVMATWDEPEEPNGRIREYILSYAPAMKPFGMKSVTYRGSTTSATIDGLTPGDRYIFKIRATNRRGQGPQSKAFSVVMPGTSRAVTTSSKRQETRRSSKKDRYKDDTDFQSTEVTEEPTTPSPITQAPPTNKRSWSLSQTRSYHSIFSSVRGSVRNGIPRGRTQDKEPEEKEEPETPTTSPPTTTAPPETTRTTTEAVEEKKEPENDVIPAESEDKENEPPTSNSLKLETISPTKPASNYPKSPPRRPVRIRVHQKPGSKDSSSTSSSSSSSDSSTNSSSSSSSSSASATSFSSSSLPFPSRTQESAASRKDYTVSTYPNSKNSYVQPSITLTKSSTPAPKQTTKSQTEAPPVGRGFATAGKTGVSSFGSRYGYGRRNIGALARRNHTRLLNGYKPQSTATGTSQSSLPGRTQNQAMTKTESSVSQSALPNGSQNHKTLSTLNTRSTLQTSQSHSPLNTDTQEALDSTSQSTSHSRSNNPTASRRHNAAAYPSTSHTGTQTSSETHNSGTSQSTAHTGTHNAGTSRNTEGLHTITKQDTTYKEEVEESDNKNTEGSHSSTSNSHTQATEVERLEKEEKEETSNAKPATSPSRVHQSISERSPSLQSRYPGRFGLGTRTSSSRPDGRIPWSRTSSSIGAGRPILRGTPTRVSGATGASGVSVMQETSDDSKTPSIRNPLKNGEGVGSVKPSLTNRNTEFSGSKDSTTSSSSSFPSTESSSNSNSHQSSGGHRDSTHRATSHDTSNDNRESYLEETSRETYDRREKVPDPTVPPKTSTLPSVRPHKRLEDNESVHTRGASTGTRPGSPVSPTHRRHFVGANGRVRSPLQVNRQLGGSRLLPRVQPAQNTRLSSSSSHSSTSSSSTSSSSSSNLPQPVLTSDRGFSSVSRTGAEASRTGGIFGGASGSTSSASSSSLQSSSSGSSSAGSVFRDSFRSQGTETRSPILRGKPTNGGGLKPGYENGKNGRPNLTSTLDKESSSSSTNSKAQSHRFITGPDGTKWVVDLEKGVLMNEDGQVLQDSQGRPKRVVIGEDGRTIFDHQGSPLVNQEGMALFGHGRDSRPVVNPKDKVLTVGGKPIVGLDLPQRRTATTTTTMAPTTTPEPTTTEWITDSTTLAAFPTCPPGTFSRTDEYGFPVLDEEGILDCYPEEKSSGIELDYIVTEAMVPVALSVEEELFVRTTLPPTTTTPTTTSPPTKEISTTVPDTRPFNNSPLSEFDLTGKKRFTAPYVNYIQKDPGAPCSLTEALEYLQVDILEDLMKKESLSTNQNQPPKNKPHNFTIVAMEGCHSFVILDWARPLKDDMVSGYMVHSASYDDVLNNRWSSSASSGTHLAVENLKPNSRYYFKVQAKNVFGLGPVSDTLTYVTESDDPLLIERPPGGEPIWIPFSFKYNNAHSACKGSQFVKRTWYRKFVGVVLCNSLRYKIFMGDGLREPFYSIGDTFGQGEDHCQFVDSHMDGRTGPVYLSNTLPTVQGYHRSYRQEPVTFGPIGRRTPHPFVGWYECGVPIPGKW